MVPVTAIHALIYMCSAGIVSQTVFIERISIVLVICPKHRRSRASSCYSYKHRVLFLHFEVWPPPISQSGARHTEMTLTHDQRDTYIHSFLATRKLELTRPQSHPTLDIQGLSDGNDSHWVTTGACVLLLAHDQQDTDQTHTGHLRTDTRTLELTPPQALH